MPTFPTNQSAFDAALFGVRAQGYVKSQNSIGTACAYRGVHPESGTEIKCGIGHSLPDELLYDSEGRHIDSDGVNGAKSIDVILASGPNRVSDFYRDCDANLLQELQTTHDQMKSPEDFEDAMVYLSKQYRLVYTPRPEMTESDGEHHA